MLSHFVPDDLLSLNRLLKDTHDEIIAAIQNVLTNKDPSLKRDWESAYGESLEMKIDPDILQAADNLNIVNNVSEFYNQLPVNSTIRSSVIQQLYRNVSTEYTASSLGLTDRAVQIANQVEAKPLQYFLINLGIPRDRLGVAEDYAVEWLEALQEPSGKSNKCYVGQFKSMYSDYFKWCFKKEYAYVSPEILNRIRRDRNIWLLKGDIFQVCVIEFLYVFLRSRILY